QEKREPAAEALAVRIAERVLAEKQQRGKRQVLARLQPQQVQQKRQADEGRGAEEGGHQQAHQARRARRARYEARAGSGFPSVRSGTSVAPCSRNSSDSSCWN